MVRRAPISPPASHRTEIERPPATVLVCTAGREALLGESIRSIAAALGPEDELLVVEAGSHFAEGVLSELGDGPWRALHLDRPGKTRQLNAGITAARGDVVLITDDDCRVEPGWVDAMLTPFAEPDVGIAFGPVRGLSEAPSSMPGHTPQPAGPAPAALWVYAHGAALAVRTAAALDVGGFDERLGPGAAVHGEEADLVLRLASSGWRCFVADAPVVEHLEWRTPDQDLQNRLVYERGAGAWLGAAFMREPLRAANLLRLRLRYQLGLFRDPASRVHARAALASFSAGLWAGLRLGRRRFLEPQKPITHDRLAPRSSLPWPLIRGRRCLAIAPVDGLLAPELERRVAAEVVRFDTSTPADIYELNPGEQGIFEVVTSETLLADLDDPGRALTALRSVCDGFFLSCEPISIGRSVLARALALFGVDGRTGPLGSVRSGLGHRRLLESAGFELHAVSRPYLVRGRAGGPLQRAVLCRSTLRNGRGG